MENVRSETSTSNADSASSKLILFLFTFPALKIRKSESRAWEGGGGGLQIIWYSSTARVDEIQLHSANTSLHHQDAFSFLFSLSSRFTRQQLINSGTHFLPPGRMVIDEEHQKGNLMTEVSCIVAAPKPRKKPCLFAFFLALKRATMRSIRRMIAHCVVLECSQLLFLVVSLIVLEMRINCG